MKTTMMKVKVRSYALVMCDFRMSIVKVFPQFIKVRGGQMQSFECSWSVPPEVLREQLEQASSCKVNVSLITSGFLRMFCNEQTVTVIERYESRFQDE